MTSRRFSLYAAAIVLLAFFLREWFVLVSWCPDPARGDAGAYLRYAQHLVFDGVFSSSEQGQPVVPDAFRGPGYPALLALFWRGEPWVGSPWWFVAIYQMQAVLGAATVACVIALGRLWLPAAWALAAGAMLAVQPHHIAATGAVLSEVVFGFAVMAGLLCAAYAWPQSFVRPFAKGDIIGVKLTSRPASMPWAIAAGALFGYAYLVNPVIAFLPLLLVPIFWRAGMAKQGAAIALVSLLAIGGWAGRKAAVDAPGDGRAVVNFVQGAWPEYHDAWKLQRMIRRADHERIVAEMAVVQQHGIAPVLDRLASDPVRYAGWYASKPYLLWDWDIRIGQGGVYSVLAENSPLDRMPMLAIVAVQVGLNGVVFALALLGIVLAFRRGGPAAMVAIAVVYVTAVHVVLQAEPRYSIPYRGLEMLLAVSAMQWLWSLRPQTQSKVDPIGVY